MTPAARTLLAVLAASRIVDAGLTVGATVLVVNRTGASAGWVAVVVAARLLPGVLLALPAVALVHGREAPALMSGLALRAGIALAVVGLPDLAPAALVAVVLVAALAGTPAKVAVSRAVVRVTPETGLARAATAFSRAEHGTTLLGAGVAGVLVLVVGVRGAAVAAAGLAVLAAVAVGLLWPRLRGPVAPLPGRLPAGARLIVGIAPARGLLILRTGARAALAVVTVVLALLPTRAGGDPALLGVLQAALAAGGTAAALLPGSSVIRPGRRLPLVAGGLLGVAVLALSPSTPLVIAAVVLVVVGAGDVLTHVTAGLALPRVVPPVAAAAASGVADSVTAVGVLLGTALAPLLVRTVGPGGACAAAAGVALLAVLLAARTLRGADPVADPGADARTRVLRTGVLSGLPPVALAGLADASRTVTLRRGDLAVAEGEAADAVFVVASGALTVVVAGTEAARTGRMTRLGPGEVFGEIGVLHARPRTATVVATEPATLVRLPADAFLQAVGAEGAAGGQVARALGRAADARLDRSHRDAHAPEVSG